MCSMGAADAGEISAVALVTVTGWETVVIQWNYAASLDTYWLYSYAIKSIIHEYVWIQKYNINTLIGKISNTHFTKNVVTLPFNILLTSVFILCFSH